MKTNKCKKAKKKAAILDTIIQVGIILVLIGGSIFVGITCNIILDYIFFGILSIIGLLAVLAAVYFTYQENLRKYD